MYTSSYMTIQFCVEVCRGHSATKMSALKVINFSHNGHFIIILSVKNDTCYCLDSVTLDSSPELPGAYCNQSCPGSPLQICGTDYGPVSVFKTSSYQELPTQTCLDFLKLGIFPNPSQCLTLSGSSGSSLECCWNSLERTQVLMPGNIFTLLMVNCVSALQ